MELLGQFTAGHDMERWQAGDLNNFVQRVLLEQIVGEADGIADAQNFMKRRATQIRIYNQDTISGLGKNRSQIERCGGFPFASAGTDDNNAVSLIILARKIECSCAKPDKPPRAGFLRLH